jgi:hypothetical protein
MWFGIFGSFNSLLTTSVALSGALSSKSAASHLTACVCCFARLCCAVVSLSPTALLCRVERLREPRQESFCCSPKCRPGPARLAPHIASRPNYHPPRGQSSALRKRAPCFVLCLDYGQQRLYAPVARWVQRLAFQERVEYWCCSPLPRERRSDFQSISLFV